jgi:hypothetical protein
MRLEGWPHILIQLSNSPTQSRVRTRHEWVPDIRCEPSPVRSFAYGPVNNNFKPALGIRSISQLPYPSFLRIWSAVDFQQLKKRKIAANARVIGTDHDSTPAWDCLSSTRRGTTSDGVDEAEMRIIADGSANANETCYTQAEQATVSAAGVPL